MIEGQKELARKLEALEQIVGEQMERIVGNQLKHVQATAKLLCPVYHGELRNSIKTMTQKEDDRVLGAVYTNKSYAPYVEFGTGPKGEADHAGISPVISPAYSQSPWWIHESKIDREAAEQYHWFYIDTPDGRFYQCTGQAAQPFMYPSLKNNEERISRNISNHISREIRKVSK